jgi:hypothetical protein
VRRPQSGFTWTRSGSRSWDVVYEKLANMVQGTRLAEEVLNRSSAVAGGI